jgi:integrase
MYNSVAKDRWSLDCDTRTSEFAGQALYGKSYRRKYLNGSERRRALESVGALQPEHALFVLTLAWTGARVSEVLAVTSDDLQIDCGLLSLITLKRRRRCVREVPIPPFLVGSLTTHFQLDELQREGRRIQLWQFSRVTAWRIVKALMRAANIAGCPSSPRGFRHGFGVAGVQAGIPLTLLQKWLGHSRLATTAIYTDVAGPEELLHATRLWNTHTQASH